MPTLIKIGNQSYDISDEHFSLKFGHSVRDATELLNLRQFNCLKSASFASSNLNNNGLALLSSLIQLEYLDLQETEITDDGTKYLTNLKNLNFLRLKDNPQLTNECIPHLTKIENLKELQINETSINQKGLEKLVVMKNLEKIILEVWKNNFTFETLLKISLKMPNCIIQAKGDGEFHNGRFDGEWNH